MKKSARRMAMLGVVGVILVSCGGSSSYSSEISVSSSTSVAASTTSSVAPTTTSTTSTSTTTTIPEPVDVPVAEIVELENFIVHIDPAALDLKVTQVVVNTLNEIAETYPLINPADVMLYATGEDSFNWVKDKTREVDCLHHSEANRFSNFIGWGDECGLIMRVDGMPAECSPYSSPCKNAATVAAHEFFHVITAQILEPCRCRPLIFGNKIPNWYNEGVADYVGYAAVFGSSRPTLQTLTDFTEENAKRPEVDTDLVQIEGLWAKGFEQPWWFSFLYERSFLAILLLVEQFGEQVALLDYYYAIVFTGNYKDAFELTFGKTIEEFSDEFEVWLDSL